ncbi:hypothetical protein D3C80_2077130 [compost metagenome]
MQGTTPITVEDFTQILKAMKKSHEKLVTARQTSWERHLDVLGHFLTEPNEGTKLEEDKS